MERNYMKSDALVELDFITNQSIAFHSHENFELMFVISGAMVIQVEEANYSLKPGDMILVNINRKHSYQGNNSLLLGRFCISDVKVRELLGMNQVLFWCNSTADRNEAYRELRRTIMKILNQSVGSSKKNKLYMTSMYYQMLHILTENFLLNPENQYYEMERKSGEDDRIQEIFAYIRANYRQNISLNDLAEQLYLSPTYVSRYIKRKCNINFIELLNQVRLTRAMEDLIYTDDSIMKIALDNGFASVAAYNKVFKDAHHLTPSEFRKQKRQESERIWEDGKKQKLLIEQKVEEYLEKNPDDLKEEENTVEINLHAAMDSPMNTTWNNYCCKMINAGTATMLLNSSVQEHILDLKKELGFEYVRFWDIYSPEMYLDVGVGKWEQNYSRLNAVIDFLVRNKMKPYMELGFKPIRILRNTQNAIVEEEPRQRFRSEEEMKNFFEHMSRHFVNRYGVEEVSTWYFEYWEENNIYFEGKKFYRYFTMEAEKHRRYFQEFGILAKCFRERIPGARIGGGGFPIRLYGEEGFTQILTVWKQETYLPSFISLNCYPYMMEQENGSYYEKRTTDMEFVKHHIEMAENAMRKVNFPEVELHVSEYSMSLSNRNVINDNCMKGAWMVYNAISCLGKADIMGHWLLSDIYSEARDTKAPLFGGNGMITKNGALKPACYAMTFLNLLFDQILVLHPNYIVTRNSHGAVRIVCHNMKKLNFQYYMTEEDEIQVRDISAMLENREYLTIHIRISQLQDGAYKVRKNRLSYTHGSVQDNWMDLDMEPEISMYEINYLNTRSVTAGKVQTLEIRDGEMEFDTVLEPNEMQYLYISLKES